MRYLATFKWKNVAQAYDAHRDHIVIPTMRKAYATPSAGRELYPPSLKLIPQNYTIFTPQLHASSKTRRSIMARLPGPVARAKIFAYLPRRWFVGAHFSSLIIIFLPVCFFRGYTNSSTLSTVSAAPRARVRGAAVVLHNNRNQAASASAAPPSVG